MTNTDKVQITTVDPRVLKHLPTKNPNLMEPHKFESLVKSIRVDGFLQPVLLVQEHGEYLIVDGVHRTRASIEVGLPEITAVVAPDRARAEVLRLALNHLRGELDLTEVGNQMQLLLDEGYTTDELTLTGFASWEVDALLSAVADDDDPLTAGVDTSPIAPPKPKSYALTFKFESESERARVKEALDKMGDGDTQAGLMSALLNTSQYREG